MDALVWQFRQESDIINPIMKLRPAFICYSAVMSVSTLILLRDNSADTMWTSVSSEINSADPAKELKLRFFFFSPTNETRCSGPRPVRLSSRRLLVLHAFPQITILHDKTTNHHEISTVFKHLNTKDYYGRMLLLDLHQAVKNHYGLQHWSPDVDQQELNTLLTGRPQAARVSSSTSSNNTAPLSVNCAVTEGLPWTGDTSPRAKKAHKHLSFLGRLRGARVRVLTVSSF